GTTPGPPTGGVCAHGNAGPRGDDADRRGENVTGYRGGVSGAGEYREVGEAAWAWVLGQVRGHDGPWLPDAVDDDPPQPAAGRDTLYAGIAGLAPALVEIARSREWDSTEAALAIGIVDRLAREATVRVEASLYDGLAGDLTALRLLAPGRESIAI